MPAIADYLDLTFRVADHVKNRTVSDVMPSLVQQGEVHLNRKLRTRYQITSDTLTFVDGVSALPADFLEIINVYGTNGYPLVSGPMTDAKRLGSQYSRYSINGSSILNYGYSGDRDIEYYAKLPSLTTSQTASNWLLEQYPNAYLYAVGLEAARFLRDVELSAITEGLLKQELRDIRIDDERARYSNAQVRVQGITP